MRKFSEIDLEIISKEEVEKQASQALKAVEEAQSAKQQIQLIMEFDKIRKTVQTIICFGMIKGQLDCNDKKYMGAYALFPLLNSMSVQFYQTITKSKFQEELRNHFGERIFEIANHQLNCTTPEALALEQQSFAISGEYDRTCANATFEIDGQTVSFAKLQLYMESPDVEIRTKACKMWSEFFQSNEEKFDEIYDKLIKNRTEQAKLLGYENYTDYSYVKWSRVKYNEDDVKAFRDAIVKYIVPVNEKLRKAQAKRIGVETLKFQDEGCKFPNGNAKPLGGEEFMVKKAQEMFAEMSPKTKEYYDNVVKYGYYDLESRQGKKQGGVCIPLIDEGLPFVYTNFNGTIQDCRVLVHESGHGYNSYVTMNEFFDYLKTSSETGETHSMGLEFLSWNWAEKFMGEDAEKYKFAHLSEAANFMPYGCLLDEYQHVVHTNTEMTKSERKSAFAKLEKKYFPTKDYNGDTFLESGTLWYKQQHLFNSAFYYIDYVLAEINALQFWKIAREESWKKAFGMYDTFCEIGGRMCFVDVVKASGLKSPFEAETVAEIAECMNKYIDSVDQSNI